MAFGRSLFLDRLVAPAPRDDVLREARRLLRFANVDEDLADVMVSGCSVQSLELLRAELNRLEPNANWDTNGLNARRYWLAQALATYLLPGRVFDESPSSDAPVAAIMRDAAEGLFDLGRGQFLQLTKAATTIVNWIERHKAQSFVLVECPLGNTVPTQVILKAATERGHKISSTLWNPPRNDRKTRGWTLQQAARDLAEQTASADWVIYVDDAITGTRFTKLFDALSDAVGRRRFAALALAFNDPAMTNATPANSQKRLVKRVSEQANTIGLECGYLVFPNTPIFHIDHRGPVRWDSPIIWGELDLIAGKRKLNLIFTLLDHVFWVWEDLADPHSRLQVHLRSAWGRDEERAYAIDREALRRTFHDLTGRLGLSQTREEMHEMAQEAFPEDYLGSLTQMERPDVKVRFDWLRTAFLELAVRKKLTPEEASFLWRGFDHTFAASYFAHRPRPRRDHDYSPMTLPFGPALRALNERLVELIPT